MPADPVVTKKISHAAILMDKAEGGIPEEQPTLNEYAVKREGEGEIIPTDMMRVSRERTPEITKAGIRRVSNGGSNIFCSGSQMFLCGLTNCILLERIKEKYQSISNINLNFWVNIYFLSSLVLCFSGERNQNEMT